MMKTVPYLHSRLAAGPLSVEDVQIALENEVAREAQIDGRTCVWGWVDRVEKYVRVIILEDGETVLNAFIDGNFTRKRGRP